MLRKALTLTVPVLLYSAGIALAVSTSGTPADITANDYIRFISHSVGAVMFCSGVGAWAFHAITGHDFGALTAYAGRVGLGGAACYGVVPWAASMGVSGALITLVR